MKSSIQSSIQCPFFLQETRNLLCCEGFIDGTCMTTKFHDADIKREYIEEHCFHIDGGACHMAQNLYAKYKKIEEQEKLEKMYREYKRICEVRKRQYINAGE